MTLAEWMGAEGYVAYRLFSSTDASDIPSGWSKPKEFSLDAAAFFDGETMTIFTDLTGRILIKNKKTKTLPLKELQTWLDERFNPKLLPSKTGDCLVGYGNRKFDLPLLLHKHKVQSSHIDLSEIVAEASKNHYGDYARRYDLRHLSTLNRKKQTALPHLSFMLKPIALISEWQRGMVRNVLRVLAAEVELIAGLFNHTMVNEEMRIEDERTERPVTVSCTFVRDNTFPFNEKDLEEE